MNDQLYDGLTQFLIKGDLNGTYNSQLQRQIELTAHQFYKDERDILYKRQHGKTRVVIPERKLTQLLETIHNHPLGGHFGARTTFDKISHKYWWPKMFESIRDHINNCDTCQKRRREKEVAPLQNIVPKTAFDHIGIDIVGPLPRTTQGNRYIIVAIDYLTKWPEARALQLADALSIAPFLYEDIICRHGIPTEVTTDRGTEFVNQLMETLWKKFKVRHITTTTYHPQGNGLVERMNQTIKNTVAKLTQDHQGDWDIYLPAALFAIRTNKQGSTRATPFLLTYGRQATRPEDQDVPTAVLPGDERLEYRVTQELTKLQQIRKEAAKFISKAQERQKKNYDSNNKEVTTLEIGDKVLLYRSVIETSWSAKLEPKWEGPYFIHNKKGTTYTLRRMTGAILPYRVHRNRLKKYHES
jgi:Integrase zinc binding domain/Integrase core domain